MADQIEAFWRAFQDALPPDSPYRDRAYVAEAFGDSPELADELGALIVAGRKTATCSARWAYEDEDAIPRVGLLSIVLDGRGRPMCIIETIEVAIKAFNQVDERLAWDEGEGDRSLAYWRAAHIDFFTRTLPQIGREMDETMPLVCERFRVIYPWP